MFFTINIFQFFIVGILTSDILTNEESLDAHLKMEHVKKVCSNSVAICKSNDSNICATRLLNGNADFLDFENACFLFIKNMCQYYGKEYSIISSGSCPDYFKSRRSNDMKDNETKTVNNETKTADNETKTADNETKTVNNETKTVDSETKTVDNETKTVDNETKTADNETKTADNETKTADNETKTVDNETEVSQKNLREETKSTLYEVDTAFDFHSCPFSCPNVYSPVCIGVNRGHGLYYKFFTFVNHCEGDLYYCKNWREFSPPPGEDELIRSSPLSWSFCAANRYIQFARFTEMTSAMGHYGWLAGDYRPTHIMEPRQRVPGFG